MTNKQIYCCQCQKEVEARLTDGKEIYKHRPDLHDLPFWKCDTCNNYVGSHHKTKDRIQPLGCIANKEIKEARKHIHRLLDPLWQNRDVKEKWHVRGKIYKHLSSELGYTFHTADIKNIKEARKVYKLLQLYNLTNQEIK